MKHRSTEQAETRKRERGSILATSAIGMLSILLAVGLGVDISRFYLAKNELQNAADAAALAAVSSLNGSAIGLNTAVARATATMNNYDFNKSGVSIASSKVLFAVNLEGPYMEAGAVGGQVGNIRFVQVTTPEYPIGVSFAAPVLGSSKNLSATATAGMSVPLTDVCNFLPVSVIDYGTPISTGNTYTFRADPGTGAISPGNYQILAVAGQGGKDVRIGLGAGVDKCAKPGDIYEVDTKPGITAGAVRQGINTRFDDFQTAQLSPQDMPPDTNIKENITHKQYLAGSPSQAPRNTGVAGRRVVIIPIVKQDQYDGGRNTVKFDRFGLFFLQTKVGSGSGGDLVAEYITDRIVGQGTFDPTAGPGNPLLATPVLYK